MLAMLQVHCQSTGLQAGALAQLLGAAKPTGNEYGLSAGLGIKSG